MPAQRHAPDPVDLIHIVELLDADEDADGVASAASVRERDRAIGREIAALAVRPIAQVMAWREARCAPHPPVHNSGDALIVACLVLGVLAGAVTAFGAFFYDGGQRVNVLLVLGLFCVLPLLSTIGFVIAAGTQHGLRAINSGQFAMIVARILPGKTLPKIAALAAGSAGPGVSKWLLLSWSQWLGLGYGLGAAAVAMGLVLFTDLAFGWSTTIEWSAGALLQLTQAIAMPWSAWLPQAVPDLVLIEASRYFRLNSDTAAAVDPLLLARWWPFVIMTMLYYGIAPRLVTVFVAHLRIRSACERALFHDVRVQRLLDRMNTPLVRTDALHEETSTGGDAPVMLFAELPHRDRWQVVNWAAVPVTDQAIEVLITTSSPRPTRVVAIEAAGGVRSSHDDAQLISRINAATTADATTGVLIIAKSWEPPTLDLIDFISAVREGVAADIRVAVMPLAVFDGAPAAPQASHQLSWQHALGNARLANVQAVAVQEKGQ